MPPRFKPKLSSKPDPWDQVVEDSTRRFNYDDTTVRLVVGDSKFKVSRRLLSTTSDVFADMFTLPEGDESQEIVLHNDPDDFRHFLWILHIDIMSVEDYNASASQETRSQRALGIATVAHMYSATRILKWAIGELLKHLPNYSHNQELMARTCRLASNIVDNPNFLATVRREWIKTLQHSDAVHILDVAKSVSDHGLLGCAYFVILQTKNNGWIAKEPSLTSLDRTRLMVGLVNLRRWEPQSSSYHNSYYQQQRTPTQDVASWAPRLNINETVTSWDPLQLWNHFSHSPFGVRFDDETDMSAHDDRSDKGPQRAA